MRIRPFKAIRPAEDLAREVACLPYDVMNRSEALRMSKDKPNSFLHVIRSEIDLSQEIGSYDTAVYEKAAENLNNMVKDGVLFQEEKPSFYLYRQVMNNRSQLGIVATFSIDDYLSGTIKKHEFTRPEKEEDRIRHFDVCNAHTEPVFLTHRSNENLTGLLNIIAREQSPVYDFVTEDGICHTLWVISDESAVDNIQTIFHHEIDCLYIADGHHRTASSAKIGLKRREETEQMDTDDPSQYFMAVSFPEEDLLIMEYNRVVKDLHGMSEEEFLERIAASFNCEAVDAAYRPKAKHEFAMFLHNRWYKLVAKPHTYDPTDIISQLDVSILQNHLLEPILGIADPRTDSRIDFVGGIRGIGELEQRVEKDMRVAFALHPTTIEDLLKVADENKIMPPKSTWFEPKLRSGLFIHSLKG